MTWILVFGFHLIPISLIAQEFRVGGFIAMELEVLEEEGKDIQVLAEINKARLNFGLQMTDRVSILAEYNAVPEELIHQVDEFTLKNGRTITPKRSGEGTEGEEEEEEETLPFERLEIRWERVRGKNLNFMAGQLRNPFGFWEDFTAHRNTTGTKNNALVLGIALRNVDIGAQADGTIGNRIRYVVGLRNGATVRTQRPSREDDNGRKDMVGKCVLDLYPVSIGLNAYFVDTRAKKYAFGAEYIIPLTSPFTLSGESIIQRNDPDRLESLSSYLQANYNLFDLLEGLRAYALFDYWQLNHEEIYQGDSINLLTGLKYKVIPRGVTLSAEYGIFRNRPTNQAFESHFATQVEVSF